MSYSKEIGSGIRAVRKSRKMSIKELAEEAAKYTDEPISATMISYWETGKRRIYADQLGILCKALDCVPANILPMFSHESSNTALELYNSLPPSEKDIIRYCANTWHGNNRALVYFMGLYMALDLEYRKDLANYGIWRYEEAVKKNHLDPDSPPIPIDYIRDQADKIGRG